MIILYFLTYLGLIIYSYTQIDLNLTLSSNTFYQQIQQQLIQLGYFNRPVSAIIFSLLLLALSFLYIWALKTSLTPLPNTRQKFPYQNFPLRSWVTGLTIKHVWKLVLLAGILIFAYPAFSHDIFNYMFDARIVTHYGLDPVFFRALDFPSDPWVRFMHWTHRYYPYGPAWLLVSLLPSFLGMGKFVLTLILFKLVFFFSYIINNWCIYRLMLKFRKEHALSSVIAFGLNPLVLIESIVSPHNEVVMTTFLLLGLLVYAEKRLTLSLLSLLISGAIKFLTFFIVPVWVLFIQTTFIKKLTLSIMIWFIALFPVIATREAYSWYFLPITGLIFLTHHIVLKRLIFALSIALESRYIPYLLIGDYVSQTYVYQNFLTIGVFLVCFLVSFVIWKKDSLRYPML